MTAHPGPLLSDILLSSPIFTDEEGAPLVPLGQGFEFGIDPTEDPELAMVMIPPPTTTAPSPPPSHVLATFFYVCKVFT